ncbi:glycosyltransferase family 4 protein [Thalassotalea marina]|uniref:Glycosyltransferase WbuB n=1 Tax=Thalassotalea marina TaxID=1673741 RepID=A0A919BGM0_9GAMM|nr:glycosyltransferase family 4 protein [Thalassotalea marina]GHF87862.1 glycosyltransferase WbuB [Thalassotalea marina]
MKFLYFHQHFSTPEGATGIRSYEMAKAMVAKGHKVTMVCGSYQGGNTGLKQPFINGQRRGHVDGIEVIEFELNYANAQSFSQRSLTFLKFAYRSVKISLTHDYDAIFATTTPLTAAIPGIIARWFKGKTFIFEVRDLWPELPKAMGVIKNPVVLLMMSVLEWLAYKSAHGHIGLAPGIVTGITKHLSQQNKVALIPNGCDLSIFANTNEAINIKGINDDDFVAVFSGTHGKANGLHALLPVAQYLQKHQYQQIKILLIGQGQLKAELIEQAKQLSLNNIIFHDAVDKHTLAKILQRADVGLQILANIPAFYYGTSPNKFFDYLSAGLPVVNNYPGWVAELIEQYQCGIAVAPEHSEALASALIELAQNPTQKQKFGQNAQRLAQRKFNREDLAKQWVEYVEQVVATHD